MSGAVIQFRDAVPADALKLAEFSERTFRHTFDSENTPEDMLDYVSKSFGEKIQLKEIQDPHRRILLALNADNQIVGYSHLVSGALEASVKGPRPIELMRLYVDAQMKGQGLAAKLMQLSIERAQAEGFQTLWLGVWEKNPRAISFYRKWQFVEVGDHVFELGSDRQRDLIMARSI